MGALLESALMLDYPAAERAASVIAGSTPVPRAIYRNAGEDPHLPGEFHQYERQLRQRAKRLARAAREQNSRAVARAYGAMTETCVSCHALFVEPQR